MQLTDSIIIPDGVAFEKLGDETIMLNLNTGKYYALNSTAALMLDSMNGSNSIESCIDKISDSTTLVDVQHIKKDLIELVEHLNKNGLIEIVSQ